VPCIPYLNRGFEGSHHLHLQGRKSAEQETGVRLVTMLNADFLLVRFLKRLTSVPIELHEAISQRMALPTHSLFCLFSYTFLSSTPRPVTGMAFTYGFQNIPLPNLSINHVISSQYLKIIKTQFSRTEKRPFYALLECCLDHNTPYVMFREPSLISFLFTSIRIDTNSSSCNTVA
jgi:hypothetical protein